MAVMMANEFVDLCRRTRLGVASFNFVAAFLPGAGSPEFRFSETLRLFALLRAKPDHHA
jgi:hypothetical protein